MKMRQNKKHVTTEQLLLLLDELEANPTLLQERATKATKNVRDIRWDLLVAKLNAVPNGAKRSVPRWKTVLTNWKLTVKKQANADEYKKGLESLDPMGKRLLRILEVDDVIRDISKELDTENNNGFRRLKLLRRSNRMRSRLSMDEFGRRSVLLDQHRKQKSLKTIFGSNVGGDGTLEKQIVRQQLDRMYFVSQQLENHIQSVQNRIQMIKDMWQHECVEE